jgi:uncharacterized protein YcaQ
LRSADSEAAEKRPGGWWNWKEEKLALEALFATGQLMIASRRNFQRLYDLSERVLPEWSDELLPDRSDAERALALKAVRSLGVATEPWVRNYFYDATRGTPSHLEALANEGALEKVRIAGVSKQAYVLPGVESALSQAPEPSRAALLSPFDPIVSDRARALALFDFDYRIECYTPAAQRRYGYFTLPILWRDRLIGRLDPKAYRREGIFEVKSLHIEPGVEVDDGMIDGLAAMLRDCAAWHGTPEVVIRRASLPQLTEELNRRLNA